MRRFLAGPYRVCVAHESEEQAMTGSHTHENEAPINGRPDAEEHGGRPDAGTERLETVVIGGGQAGLSPRLLGRSPLRTRWPTTWRPTRPDLISLFKPASAWTGSPGSRTATS